MQCQFENSSKLAFSSRWSEPLSVFRPKFQQSLPVFTISRAEIRLGDKPATDSRRQLEYSYKFFAGKPQFCGGHTEQIEFTENPHPCFILTTETEWLDHCASHIIMTLTQSVGGKCVWVNVLNSVGRLFTWRPLNNIRYGAD